MISITRKKSFFFKYRKFKVLIDGIHCGDIKQNETKSFDTKSNEFTVQVVVDLYKSNILNVSQSTLPVNIEIELDKFHTWLGFLLPIVHMVISRDSYIKLEVK